jgi:hypothetical protein
MLVATYKTKKDLKAAIGQSLQYEETSLFGQEYSENATFPVIGPSTYVRKWYAKISMVDGKISKVS